MRLLIATTNPGKLREIRFVLQGLPIEIVTLADCDPVAEPEENGLSFVENARTKALAYAAATGLMTVAEDSGLVVDALDGAPGVESARFNGATYPEKFARLYAMLAERGTASSSARFVCAAVIAEAGEVLFEARGTVEGTLVNPPQGTGGFGYDPILFHPASGRTLAEMSESEKAALSHRGQAFREVREFLAARLAELN